LLVAADIVLCIFIQVINGLLYFCWGWHGVLKLTLSTNSPRDSILLEVLGGDERVREKSIRVMKGSAGDLLLAVGCVVGKSRR
jgi:hypothetical protein